MPPTPQSFKHTGMGNQKKPEGWESPPPLPAPGTPEFESWASQSQRDTSGGNSRMVGHQEKARNASEPDVNPHRINLDTTGAEVDSDVAAMHAAHADIANDEQFGAHKPEAAKTKLGGGEIDPKGIADFQAKMIADRKARGVPEQGDFAQRKSAWEAAGGSSGTGTAEEANAMLKAHRSAADAPDAGMTKKAPRAPKAVKAEPSRPDKASLAAKEEAHITSKAAPAAPAPVTAPSDKPAPSAPSASSGKLERIGGNFAPRSTPTSMSIPSNAAGTKFTVLKAKGEGAPAAPASPSAAPAKSAPAAPAENKTRFMPTAGKPAAPAAPSVPVSPPLASSRPAAPSIGAAPRVVHPAAARTAHAGKPAPSLPPVAASKSIGAGNKAPSPSPSAPPAQTTPSAPASATPRAPRSTASKSVGGDGWGEVHHHIHNYYGATQIGDQYVNHGGVQNIGGTMSIGQSGGSVGGGSGHGGSGGGNPRTGNDRAPRPAAPSYGKPSIGQALVHTALNSTVNGKSVNDTVHAVTGKHIEQHDTQGRRIGDPHSDAHKMGNIHRAEGHGGAAAAYHAHEAMRSQRLGQQFTP
jgi:hypothetical protein